MKKKIGAVLILIAVILFFYLLVTFEKDPPASFYIGSVVVMVFAFIGTFMSAEGMSDGRED